MRLELMIAVITGLRQGLRDGVKPSPNASDDFREMVVPVQLVWCEYSIS